MSSPSRPGDLSLTSVLDQIRYRLIVLIEAIIANRPFDALCAAARFRTVLEHIEYVVRALPDDRRVSAFRCVDHVRSIAAPILALASAPARAELRALHGSAPEGRERPIPPEGLSAH